MRLCIVYDCLYPWTKGGAERWYRHLGDVLLSEGHTVTFVTRKQWDSAEPPVLPGAEVISVSPRTDLYHEDGRRRVAPPIWFGAGVFWHLLRNRTRYDAVHLCSFPYFTLPAARVALAEAARAWASTGSSTGLRSTGSDTSVGSVERWA